MINIKADKEVKEGAQKVAADLGLPLSTIMNAFLKEFIRSKSVTFSVIPRMTPYLENVLDRVEHDLKSKKNIFGPFATAKEMDRYLDSL